MSGVMPVLPLYAFTVVTGPTYFYCTTGGSCGPGSSVGIATGYGLDGPGMESRLGGRDFPYLSRPALGPT